MLVIEIEDSIVQNVRLEDNFLQAFFNFKFIKKLMRRYD
jgi:hypothetical protein